MNAMEMIVKLTEKTVVVVGATGTREVHPGAMDFDTWLDRTGASRIAAFLDAARTAGQDA